ncbi:hypothetical protein M0R45_006671 [Rubus argutus]|uniref:Uncharacterized protein n=1 Tax=Rubus argutus TaxID=59490 RepID=A0AAW1YRV7_RUBAR
MQQIFQQLVFETSLLPTIQNLLKDSDALDPAHKEDLEIIMKERSGGTFETISKKDNLEPPPPEPVESPKAAPVPPVEDTRFRRIMRGNFTEMLRGKVKGQDENLNQ